jgi:hypothetical protein
MAVDYPRDFGGLGAPEKPPFTLQDETTQVYVQH